MRFLPFTAGYDIPVIIAVAGEDAIIPCNFTTPLEDDGASLILWYRLDKPNPIYTLDVRSGPVSQGRHFPMMEMGERIYFNVSVHPPTLVFSSVTPEDAVPPHEPIIMDEYGQRLRGVIGKYDEGSTLTFICDVDGGDPHPSVTWWRGDTLLDDDYNVTTKGFVRNKLTLNEIRRSDLLAQYSCITSNTNLTKAKKESIQLDMNPKYSQRLNIKKLILRVNKPFRLHGVSGFQKHNPESHDTFFQNSIKDFVPPYQAPQIDRA
ncbi:uncharacterized protein TNIN_138471 [Trichonephila inaurata madagascariensis]|uniref:Ig-like domain-containing protein n=1 Tax=Trichonephila inaurata madagascariensis TaxID=2747483 RepID=A0A8X6XVH2_9ARAC|nr:uncharacterized protein TNIN_138471 [Trichonephila inaurata madagascariensis]